MATSTSALPNPTVSSTGGTIPNTIVITIATPADIPAILTIGRDTWKATFTHLDAANVTRYLDSTYTVDAMTTEMVNDGNTFLVAREESEVGKVIGFLQLKRNTTDPCLPPSLCLIELNRIYMHHLYTSRGTGKLLVEAAHDIARSEGYEGCWLGVWEEHVRGRRFYERCGYVAVGKHEFRVGGQVDTDDVLLRRF